MCRPRTFTRFTSMPQRRAVSSLEPMATTWRPKRVRRSSTAVATPTASISHTAGEKTRKPRAGRSTRASSPRVSTSIFCSWARPLAAPRRMLIEPSVTMNGVMPSPATSAPLTAPVSAATAMPASAAGKGPTPALSSEATTTVVSATVDPTERSMPPSMMIMVMPAAATPTTAVCRAMVIRFAGRAKVSGESATKSR